jgi:hypothetical protein
MADTLEQRASALMDNITARFGGAPICAVSNFVEFHRTELAGIAEQVRGMKAPCANDTTYSWAEDTGYNKAKADILALLASDAPVVDGKERKK